MFDTWSLGLENYVNMVANYKVQWRMLNIVHCWKFLLMLQHFYVWKDDGAAD